MPGVPAGRWLETGWRCCPGEEVSARDPKRADEPVQLSDRRPAGMERSSPHEQAEVPAGNREVAARVSVARSLPVGRSKARPDERRRIAVAVDPRSEERRVGKEGRDRA